MYAFAGSDPIRKIDYVGLMGCRTRRCCCCVDDIDIENISKVNKGGTYGHYFHATVKLTYKEAISAGTCTVTWKEWSDRPPGGEPANTWQVPAIWSNSQAKSVWDSHVDMPPCPGSDSFSLPDEPTAWPELAPRTMYFKITVKSFSNCSCSYSSKLTCAKQVLYADAGTIYIQKLDQVDCWTLPPDPDDPVLGPSPPEGER